MRGFVLKMCKVIYRKYIVLYEMLLNELQDINKLITNRLEKSVTDKEKKHFKQLLHENKAIKTEYEEGLKFWRKKMTNG